jgi:NADPH:quinone reductase-like Zn-dependent oxidoreductase
MNMEPQMLSYEETPRPEPKDDETKARGARVIATASTATQGFLKKLGADQAIDYRKTKFKDVVNDVDLVLDAVGGDTLTRSYGVGKKGGIIVTIAGKAALYAHGIRGVSISTAAKGETFAELACLIEDRKLTPVVTQVFPLSEVAKTQDQIATRHTRGKVVLRVAPDQKSR